MIRNPREKDLPPKQKGSISDDHKAPPTSTKLWSGLKNPRIVCVSRAFGGKDRHSKVSTIRGLRDRRVRLSVPTAIQLYDLQDRLGLNQPSKVVDWLLNAAQHEIDKLPSLPESFSQFSQSLPLSHEAPPSEAPSHVPLLSAKNFGYMNEDGAPRPIASLSNKANGEGLTTFSQSTYWNSDTKQREDPKESLIEKGYTIKRNDMAISPQVSAAGHPSVSGFLSNTMPYTSYYHWEASNAYLSQLGLIRPSQSEARSLAPESQIVLCPPGVMPSMFSSYVATPTDFNPKQSGQLQMGSLESQTPQSNSTRNPLHLGGPSARPF